MLLSARTLCAAGLGLALLAGPFTAAGAGELEAISITGDNGRVEFHLSQSSPSADRQPVDAFLLTDPHRLVVDFPGVSNPVVPEGALPEGVTGVRWSVYRDDPAQPVVRYVLELTQAMEYEVIQEDGGVTVCALPVAPVTVPAPAMEKAPALGTVNPPPTADLVPIVPEIVVDSAPPESASPDWREDTRTMSLDVQGTDINAVLRSIAEFAGISIVPDKDIHGPVNLRVDDLPWPKVLDAVCLSQGIRAIPGDHVIRVATLKTTQSEELEIQSAARRREDLMPLSTRVIPVDYAKAVELQESLAFLLSARGRLESNERTNTLLVSDINPRVDALESMVRDLDTETVQVRIKARLVDADVTAARKLGISWDVLNLHSGSVSGRLSQMTADLVDAAGEYRLGVVDDFGELDATLQLLEDQNEAEIISSPSITTVSNREARILIGKEVPLIVLDEAGNPTTELKKVGITLRVTPYVNRDGKVTLDLHPEVSDLSAQSTVQGGVVFTTTEADTRVMVDSGQTAVIGGLVRESLIEFERGIPILKDIPILGYLFKKVEKTKEKRELMIFVTPEVSKGIAELQE